MIKTFLIIFLLSVCILSMPDLVNLKKHSDDYIQISWFQIRKDIFRESPSAPQRYVMNPLLNTPSLTIQIDRKS
jgi:hypothetical protein